MLEVPQAVVLQDQPVDHVDGGHEAEVGVQDGQVDDEDVRRGRVALLAAGDLSHDHQVQGRADRQVDDLRRRKEEEEEDEKLEEGCMDGS